MEGMIGNIKMNWISYIFVQVTRKWYDRLLAFLIVLTIVFFASFLIARNVTIDLSGNRNKGYQEKSKQANVRRETYDIGVLEQLTKYKDIFKPDTSRTCEDQERELSNMLVMSLQLLEGIFPNDYKDTMGRVRTAQSELDINFNKYTSEFYYVVKYTVRGRGYLENVDEDDYDEALDYVESSIPDFRLALEELRGVCDKETNE